MTAARASPNWLDLLTALHDKSADVGSDLNNIWQTLETGRLEWLGAVAAAHPLKAILKEARSKDKNRTEKDVVDMKMVYIYALSLSIESLANEAEAWRKVVRMENKTNPLQNYNGDLWDPRKDEWRPLDLGVQEAAERGGSSAQTTSQSGKTSSTLAPAAGRGRAVSPRPNRGAGRGKPRHDELTAQKKSNNLI